MPSRLEIAKPDIVQLFDSAEQKVYALSEIKQILHDNLEFWRLGRSMSAQKFVQFLVDRTAMKQVRYNFKNGPITLYTWRKVPFHEVLLFLKPSCYLSHYSAVYFNDLTEQEPKTVYINAEQTPKYQDGTLEQSRIDWAFKRPTRLSKNIARKEGRTIYLLNGMYTRNLGVIEMLSPEGERLRVTDVERTLIDITVRPEYAGGVFEVLKAYRAARKRVSVNRLVATLKKIGFIYPYHQVIGFYLERAGGYSESQLDLLRKFEMEYDFYLVHHMKDMDYAREWRLYYPKGFG